MKIEKGALLRTIEREIDYHEMRVGMDEMEKITMGLFKRINPAFHSEGIPALSLREAYEMLTGDYDSRGFFDRHRLAPGLITRMDINSATFPLVLASGLNAYLSKIYRDVPYREEILISERRPARDFREIDSLQLSYFSDIEEVDPETGNFNDGPALADTGAAQYRVTTKGRILWITRMAIINDNVEAIKRAVQSLSKAARRTHARKAWSFFIDNATSPDGTAWFTAAHGNLGSGALTIPNVATAIGVLANMAEPGSDEKLGLDLASFNWHLVAGNSNWQEAVKVNQHDSYFSANDLTTKVANPCKHLFGEKNERVVICPFITDADDWGVIRSVEDVPIVEMSYLNGKEEPELIIAEGPKDEFVFTQDRIGYKIRHEYGGTLANYRGGYKSIP